MPQIILDFATFFLGFLLPVVLHATHEAALYAAFMGGRRLPGWRHAVYRLVWAHLSQLDALTKAALALCAAGGSWVAAVLWYTS